ncbi:hypothetical protein KY285_007931 [Solanum tuberosum]|nr:hypothetical protein KY285_007931 [Solanum tuberosum]
MDSGQGILLSSDPSFELLAFCNADYAACPAFHHSVSDLSAPLHLPMIVYSYSQAVIHIGKNPVFHERMKFVDLDFHFFRQQFISRLITLSIVPSTF